MPNVGPIELLLVLLLWVAPAYLVAAYSRTKGQSFRAYLVIGLVASWIVSLLFALKAEDKSQPDQIVVAPSSGDHLDQLQKITDLRDAGTLSAEEFDAERDRILQGR